MVHILNNRSLRSVKKSGHQKNASHAAKSSFIVEVTSNLHFPSELMLTKTLVITNATAENSVLLIAAGSRV